MSKKQLLIYGLCMGLLLLLLEIVQYKVSIREIRVESFGIIIGVLFLTLGIWIGNTYQQKKSLSGKFADQKLGLSNRELEVLELIAEGYSNQEIGERLFVSLNTVKTHISKIYEKLNVKRRTQAIQRASELGFLTSGTNSSQNHPKV